MRRTDRQADGQTDGRTKATFISPFAMVGAYYTVADIPGRRALCSACTDRLEVPFQTFHHRRPSFSGCRLTDLELTTRHSRFGINTAVVPAPIENFSISTILHLLAL